MISISQDELATLKEVTELINADSVSKVIIRVNEENKPTGVLKIFDVCELPIGKVIGLRCSEMNQQPVNSPKS